MSYRRSMKTVLAPIDFSPVSESVVREAAEFARALDAQVVLLTVVQPPVVFSEYAGLMNVAEITTRSEKQAAKLLEEFEEKLANAFIKAKTIQLTGSPITQIVDQAGKLDADYIVLGSHGHTAFYDLLVGSTTHGVLMRAKCPVVIVPANREQSKPRVKPKRSVTV
jgi:nucleotide-binding universal stress UspA family protein